MGLFDLGTPSTLSDVLGQQADTATLGVNNSYAQRKRKEAAIAAASGRLTSGVQNYTTADTNASQLGELGGIQSSLASSLGAIPAEDYKASQDAARNEQLLNLMAKMRGKSGGLSGALGGAMAGASAGSAAGPWGALGGGLAGGAMGYYS